MNSSSRESLSLFLTEPFSDTHITAFSTLICTTITPDTIGTFARDDQELLIHIYGHLNSSSLSISYFEPLLRSRILIVFATIGIYPREQAASLLLHLCSVADMARDHRTYPDGAQGVAITALRLFPLMCTCYSRYCPTRTTADALEVIGGAAVSAARSAPAAALEAAAENVLTALLRPDLTPASDTDDGLLLPATLPALAVPLVRTWVLVQTGRQAEFMLDNIVNAFSAQMTFIQRRGLLDVATLILESMPPAWASSTAGSLAEAAGAAAGTEVAVHPLRTTLRGRDAANLSKAALELTAPNALATLARVAAGLAQRSPYGRALSQAFLGQSGSK